MPDEEPEYPPAAILKTREADKGENPSAGLSPERRTTGLVMTNHRDTIHYRIHLSDQKTIDVQAAKINVGVNRLWFFDAEENLIAVFRWDNIQGFSVDGSASGQTIIEDLPHEQKAAERKAEEMRQARGPVLHALATADQSLKNVRTVMGSALLALYDLKGKISEAGLLVTQQRDELLRYEARLTDHQREIDGTIGRIKEQLVALLKPPK